MLRAALAVLLAANLLFFGYTRGAFDGLLGLHSLGDREPERLARQVRPDSVRILSAGPGASGPLACFEAGPFAAYEAIAAESALNAALPAGTWTDERTEASGTTGPVVMHTYRVAAADSALAARLAGVKFEAPGKTFAACTRGPR